jgi:hypothetical protein
VQDAPRSAAAFSSTKETDMKEIDKRDAPKVNGGLGPRDSELQPYSEPLPDRPIANEYPAAPNPR